MRKFCFAIYNCLAKHSVRSFCKSYLQFSNSIWTCMIHGVLYGRGTNQTLHRRKLAVWTATVETWLGWLRMWSRHSVLRINIGHFAPQDFCRLELLANNDLAIIWIYPAYRVFCDGDLFITCLGSIIINLDPSSAQSFIRGDAVKTVIRIYGFVMRGICLYTLILF